MTALLVASDRRLGQRRSASVRPAFFHRFDEVAEARLPLVAAMFGLLAIECVWTELSGISVTGIWLALAEIVAFVAAGSLGQMAGSHGTAAGWPSSRLVGRFGEFISNVGLYCLFCFALLFLSHLCARSTLSLHDTRLAASDAALGFNWPGWHGVVQRHPYFDGLLDLAYHSLKLQVVVTCLLMAFSSDRQRAIEFLWLALATGVVACVVSGLLPSVGAAAHFHFPASPATNALLLLRGTGAGSLDFTRMDCIITFPSYHSTLAVLVTWANRRMGAITAAFAALNILVLVSAPTADGHYLVDVIAGTLLGVAAVAIAARVRWTRLSLAQALG